MQQEFINVAAHELRTPVQPILSIVGVLRSTKGNIDKDKLDNSIDVIDRNAKRLKRLTEDLLDATKIECQSLQLNKEVLNLNELISSAIQDIKNQIEDRSVRVWYEPKREDIIFLEAVTLLNSRRDTVELYLSVPRRKKDMTMIIRMLLLCA